jgi:iron complex transport system substrate-binding protein
MQASSFPPINYFLVSVFSVNNRFIFEPCHFSCQHPGAFTMAYGKISALLLSVLIGAVLISGCTSSTSTGDTTTQPNSGSYPLTVTDDSGRVMTFGAPPQRIVSLSPSNTEIIYALGLGDRLAGVDLYSNYPPEAAAKPQMGGMVNVSESLVVAAKPDLVLVSQFTPAETVDNLSAAGLTVFCSHPDNASDTERTITLIGAILGVPDRAQLLFNRMMADVGQVTEQTSRLDASRRPSVLMVITLGDECYVADQDNYMDDLIRIGGGRNLATGPVMTPDQIAQANPDIIIVPLTYWTLDTFEGLQYAREPWMQNLTAVRTGRVCAVGYDVVGRPGPRIGSAAEIMARTIHPELFY